MDKYLLVFDFVNNFSSVNDGIGLLKEIKDAIEREKEGNPDFDDSWSVDIDTFFVMDQVKEIQELFAEIEGRLEDDWENGLKHFDKYVQEYDGDVLVPGDYCDEDGFNLGIWVWNRRRDFKHGVLLDNRINELNRRGFVWNIYEYKFETYIKALKQYCEREGNCLVSQKHIEIVNGIPINLGKWYVAIQCSKRGSNIYKLTDEMEIQLNQLGFIWDTSKYKFENNVKMVQEYYKKYGKYPAQSDNNSEGKKLGNFIIHEKIKMRHKEYPNWKIEIIKKYLPDFSGEIKSDETFNRFIYYANLYKNKYGHIDIKSKDVINGYNIGSRFGTIKKLVNNKKMSETKLKQLNELGVYLGNKSQFQNQKLFDKNMELVRLALDEGIIINEKNQMYQEKNLYCWIKNNIKNKYVKGELLDEQIETIEKLIGKPLYKINNGNFVKVVDVVEKREIAICKSQNAAIDALQKILCEKISKSVAENRLNGKVTTPYKGRFMFYYATDEEVKKYLEDGKAY